MQPQAPWAIVKGAFVRALDEGVSPEARRAMYSVSEIPIQRCFVSRVVLCQEHSLSASRCQVQHQRLIQGTVLTCASTVRMKNAVLFHVRATVTLKKVRWTNDGNPTGEPQACADLSLGSSVVWDCDRLCATGRAQGLASRAMLPATRTTLFSSASLLCVLRMGLFPGAFGWLALVRNSMAWRGWHLFATVLVSVIMAEQNAPMAWLGLARVCVER